MHSVNWLAKGAAILASMRSRQLKFKKFPFIIAEEIRHQFEKRDLNELINQELDWSEFDRKKKDFDKYVYIMDSMGHIKFMNKTIRDYQDYE